MLSGVILSPLPSGGFGSGEIYAFNHDRFLGNKANFISLYAKDYLEAWRAMEPVGGLTRCSEHLISWSFPSLGYVKVNIAAGVIRDHHGCWLVGFVHSIGSCSVVMAELWGIFHGLKFAWERGYRRVCVETDSLAVSLLLCKPMDRCHPLFSLVTSVQVSFVGLFVLDVPPSVVCFLLSEDLIGRGSPV